MLPPNNPVRNAVQTVEQDRTTQIEGERQGQPSLFTCPECCGTLWQLDEPDLVQFRCHVGHVLSGEVLFLEQTEAAENSLWTAIRILTDKSVLGRQMAVFARNHRDEEIATAFEQQAQAAAEQAEALRHIAENSGRQQV